MKTLLFFAYFSTLFILPKKIDEKKKFLHHSTFFQTKSFFHNGINNFVKKCMLRARKSLVLPKFVIFSPLCTALWFCKPICDI